MPTSKVDSAYKDWIEHMNVQHPQTDDISRLFELAYQIYLARQTGSKTWNELNVGQWLADQLTKDGRFSNHQINRLSYMLDDLVSYNQWLFQRNTEQ